MAGLTQKTFIDFILPESRDVFNRSENRQIENFKEFLFFHFALNALLEFQEGRMSGEATIPLPSIKVTAGTDGSNPIPKIPSPDLKACGQLTQELLDRIDDILKAHPSFQDYVHAGILETPGGGLPCRGG